MSDSGAEIVEPFFLPLGKGSAFCLFHSPAENPKAGVLYLHPFAEEMHKSRRMAALQARCFARSGYAVLQVDLPGCGDSSGDFEEASWADWLACAQAAYGWLTEKVPRPVVLWGLRLGASLAVDVSSRLSEPAGLLLWQPVANGENHINQFLRIKVAGNVFSAKGDALGTRELRGLLASGVGVEVGGYMLNPQLAAAIDKLRLASMPAQGPAYWFEIVGASGDPIPPASAKAIDAWVQAGVAATAVPVEGDAFWSTQEITECPSLIAASLAALENLAP